MTDLTLTRIRIENGIYRGILQVGSANKSFQISAILDGDPIGVLALTPVPNKSQECRLEIELPSNVLNEGVHQIAVVDLATNTILDSFALILGHPEAEDFRSEVALLRAELELLKKALRSVAAFSSR